MDYLAYSIPLVIGALAVLLRALDWQGTITAVVFAYAIMLATNSYWLGLLVTFFIAASAATRFKESKKVKLRVKQKTRTARHVISNGLIAVIMALGGQLYGFIGAVATANADTLSSEIGVLSKTEPRLITTLKKVRTGTNGGITLLGTSMALFGALAIGVVAFIILPTQKTILIATICGFTGCLIDSCIGATLENKGLVTNGGTNLIATACGGMLGMLLSAL